jgi:glycosyltransferase involved in cell wall biosynthesis
MSDFLSNPVLIYEYRAGGHYLEYIEHLAKFVISEAANEINYVFIVPVNYPEVFAESYDLLLRKHNVEVKVLELDRNPRYLEGGRARRLLLELHEWKKIVKLYQPKLIVILTLESFLLLQFLLKLPCAYRGVLIHSPTRLASRTLRQKLVRFIKMSLLARIIADPSCELVFTLNDCDAAKRLNKSLNTSKFRCIPDPVFAHSFSSDYRAASSAIFHKKNRCILLHIGSLDRRKGTIESIRAMGLLSLRAGARISFIISGAVAPEFCEEIKEEISKIVSPFVEITFNPSRIGYIEFHALMSKSDIVVAAYKKFPYSSGILNSAIMHGVPAIVTEGGIMADIVREYSCGVVANQCTPESIACALQKVLSGHVVCDSSATSRYLTEHSPDKFATTLFT